MAYRIEGRDIVIDGFENGISDNPFEGFNQMKGVNIISTPGEASVSFGASNMAPNAWSGTISSVDTGADTITFTTVTGTVPRTGDSVTFTTSGGLPGGLSVSTTYWLLSMGSDVYQVFTNMYLTGSQVNLTSSGSGTNTATTITMGRVTQVEKNFGYVLDNNGRCWSPVSSSTSTHSTVAFYRFMNNTITNASGNGLVVYLSTNGNYYLFVFRNAVIDYTSLGTLTPIQGGTTAISWVTGWQTMNTVAGSSATHQAIIGQDNVVYYCDGQFVGSFREKVGSSFDPASSGTYTWTLQALALPKNERAICLAEQGTNLMVGGIQNFVYPWDRISSSYKYPMLLAEKFINSMVTVNNSLYISAGSRGRIFISNGSNADLWVKIPDHISGTSDPIISVFDLTYFKNQIYFGCLYGTTGTQSGTSYAGIWAVDVDTKALRTALISSTATSTTVAICGVPTYVASTTGLSFTDINLITFSYNFSTSVGIADTFISTPNAEYYTSIDTDMVPIGLFLTKRTFENVEWKTTKPLVSGEAIKISARTNLSESYTLIKEWVYADQPLTTDVGNFNEINFENAEWVQLRYEAKSTTASPSFVRLKELRLR